MIFRRAVARGEIAPVQNLETVVSILPGARDAPLHRRGHRPDEQFFLSIIDDVILPLVQAERADVVPSPLK